MDKICTSLEQSKKFLEFGIDINTADMRYSPLNPDIPWVWVSKPLIEKDAIPAWSLTALLIVLPQGTRLLKSATDEMYHCDCPKGNIDKWFDNPIDACYEVVCLLKENNKI